jgi:hypothetical protein
MSMNSMHLHIIFLVSNDSTIIRCGNIDIKEIFLEQFWCPNFSMYFELWFFLIKYFI